LLLPQRWQFPYWQRRLRKRAVGGCAVGVGVAAGVVAGAIVGSAIANSYGPAYAVQPGYAAYPGYAAAGPVACPGGYWARRPVAFDAYGNPIGWSRPRFFCP